jgi:ABC-type nitrate/sulfonate/bicarbonate transport system substrate-binding protein
LRDLRKLIALLSITLLAAAACGESEPNKVVFMAGFKPQANLPFVAAYVAQEEGFFEEQGLEVDILHSTRGQHLQLLLAGDVDFTTAAAAAVLKRRSDPEVPIVAIALFGQRGQQAYMALRRSGIESLDDWEGRTFGYKTSVPPDYLAMLGAAGVDRSTIREVNAGFDPRVLTEGKVDVLAVFKSNEPYIVRNLPDSSFELNMWDPADFGVPTMGLTYIARQETVDREPDVTERFLKATLKGIEYIIDNPDGALDTVMEYAPDEDRDHMRFMLEAEQADAVSAVTREHGLGWMTRQQWQEFHDLLVRYQALARELDVEQAFAAQFLEAAYQDGRLVWP